MNVRFAPVLVGLLVILAGCTGGGGGDGAGEPTITPTPTPGGGSGSGGSGSGGGSGGDGGTNGLWGVYEFRQGERYEFEFEEFAEPVGTLSWEVLSVSGSATDPSVTVRASGEFGGEAFEQTVTGSPETVYFDLLGSSSGTYILLALYSPFVGSFRGEELAVGEGWSYDDGIDTYSYRVERTDSVAGRDVFVTVVRVNDEPVWETWIDPDLALAAKTVVYDEDGAVQFQAALVDYRG
jgi:hypothetical protein